MVYPNLRREMSEAGITTAQVADAIGKSCVTVYNWISGRHGSFPYDACVEVRDAFFPGMSVDYLFSNVKMDAHRDDE